MQLEEIGLEEIERTNRVALDSMVPLILELEREIGTPEPSEMLEIFLNGIPGRRMLDAGCGSARYVYRFIDNDLEYTGIDLSPEMVAATKKAYPNLRFEEMSYRRLEFEAESFDGVWCCCTLEYEPKRNIVSVLREFYRVLAKGGIIASMTPYAGYGDEGFEYTDDGKACYVSRFSPEELNEAFLTAGFAVEMCTWDDASKALYIVAHK